MTIFCFFSGPATPLECKTGEWGEWIADFGLANIITNPKKSNLGNTDIENADIENITWVEYGYEDYDNYTSEPYEYEYEINSFDFPPVVTNCSCARNNTQYEKQTRRIKIINEGSIGGTPCVNTSQTRDCKCPNYGKLSRFSNDRRTKGMSYFSLSDV